jgi:pimeloyl-ACP methyl ester carboxylesterase
MNRADGASMKRPFASHVEDTVEVIAFARKLGFEKIALIGHSLGAPIAIEASKNIVQALVLWDPTGAPSERIREWETKDSSGSCSYIDWGMRIILGEDWIESAKTFPDPFETLSRLTIPVKIIAAENGGMIDYAERYLLRLPESSDLTIISGAGHIFSEFDAAESLARTTTDWLGSVFAI